jgi:uncharacterized protein YijF (DUF1287 family)
MDRRAFVSFVSAAALSGCSRASSSSAPPVAAVTLETVSTQGLTARLLAAAHDQTRSRVTYEPNYLKIAYPQGDLPADRGACSDVLIRAYRHLGIDLQRLVHEDMQAHFPLYPKQWGLKAPDSNIDHRRVPNLMVFFSRFGQTLPLTQNPADYRPGDILATRPVGTHIAIVSDQKHADSDRLLVIENIGGGVQQNDHLLSYPLIGHYRYAV